MTEIWIQLRKDRDKEDWVRRWVDEVLEYWGSYYVAQKSDEAANISTQYCFSSTQGRVFVTFSWHLSTGTVKTVQMLSNVLRAGREFTV
jgi:hypothetical protein